MTSKSVQKKQHAQTKEILQKLTGIANEGVAAEIICLGAKASSDSSDAMQIAAQALREEKPSDLAETRLVMQAHALYAQGMKNLSRAEEADLPYHAELRMNFAMKLLRLHNETIEILDRYRRRGGQTVVVQHQHVQVNDGGRAIIGTQMMEGGGSKLKSEEPHG